MSVGVICGRPRAFRSTKRHRNRHRHKLVRVDDHCECILDQVDAERVERGQPVCRDGARRFGGSTGTPRRSSRIWYLVRLRGHGFHQPGPAGPIFGAVAGPIESHDPTNPNLEIPKIGLTIVAQVRCVELVVDALTTQAAGERS